MRREVHCSSPTTDHTKLTRGSPSCTVYSHTVLQGYEVPTQATSELPGAGLSDACNRHVYHHTDLLVCFTCGCINPFSAHCTRCSHKSYQDYMVPYLALCIQSYLIASAPDTRWTRTLRASRAASCHMQSSTQNRHQRL